MASASLLSIYVSPIYLLLFAHLAVSWRRAYAKAKSADPAIALIVVMIPFIYVYNLISARLFLEEILSYEVPDHLDLRPESTDGLEVRI